MIHRGRLGDDVRGEPDDLRRAAKGFRAGDASTVSRAQSLHCLVAALTSMRFLAPALRGAVWPCLCRLDCLRNAFIVHLLCIHRIRGITKDDVIAIGAKRTGRGPCIGVCHSERTFFTAELVVHRLVAEVGDLDRVRFVARLGLRGARPPALRPRPRAGGTRRPRARPRRAGGSQELPSFSQRLTLWMLHHASRARSPWLMPRSSRRALNPAFV